VQVGAGNKLLSIIGQPFLASKSIFTIPIAKLKVLSLFHLANHLSPYLRSAFKRLTLLLAAIAKDNTISY
jgi:hypothetical protein